jgi:hypothetical protein
MSILLSSPRSSWAQKSHQKVKIMFWEEKKIANAINNNGVMTSRKKNDEWGKGRRKIGNKNFVNFFTLFCSHMSCNNNKNGVEEKTCCTNSEFSQSFSNFFLFSQHFFLISHSQWYSPHILSVFIDLLLLCVHKIIIMF